MSEITRTEKFLRACIDGEPCKLKPLTRMEKLLAELNETLAGGPSEVVILPETVLKLDDGNWLIPTPLSATPTEGKTCTVTCNGVAYDCPVFNYPGALETTLVMGATKEMGLPGGNDNAPFVVMLLPGGDNGMYGMCMYDGEVDSITLSIVEKAETASAGSGGKFIVTATMGGVKDEATGTMEVTFDKTHLDAKTAHENGQNVFCIFDIGLAFDGADNAGDYCYFPVLTYNVNTNQIVFGAYINGMSFTVGMHSDPSLDFLEVKLPQV